MMKILYKISKVLLGLTLIFVYSCNQETAPSLYDLPVGNQPTPTITTIDPPNAALAGVTVVTLTGSNFNTNIANNFVYFNGVPGDVISATSTELKVKVPNIVADTVKVKVSVYKSENFSNILNYKLLATQEEYFPFNNDNGQFPNAFIFNSSGDMLVSLTSTLNTNPLGIKRVSPDRSELLDYIPMGNAQKWDCLKYGPGGQLYGSRTVNAIWKLNEGVPPASPWTNSVGSLNKDIDFDVNQNIWAVGTNNRILRFTQTPSATSFTVTGVFRSARVFNGALYVAGAKGSSEGVWKYNILTNGDLDVASEELYFDLSSAYPGTQAFAITFAADGDLILGTNKDPDPLIIVHPNKNSEVLYPGVIPASKVLYMYWPEGSTSLYFTRDSKSVLGSDGTTIVPVYNQTILRVEMQKLGAPYYGM